MTRTQAFASEESVQKLSDMNSSMQVPSHAENLMVTRHANSSKVIVAFLFFFIHLGAFLIAAQLRLSLAWGKELGEGYRAQPPVAFLILVLAALVGVLFYSRINHEHHTRRPGWYLLRIFVLTLIGSAIALLILLPDLSGLQVVEYSVLCIAMSLVFFTFLPDHVDLLFPYFQTLWSYRVLFGIQVRYNIKSRYSQTILGILWIILFPLLTSLILAFVFGNIMRMTGIVDVPFVSFFLVGFTFWALFQQGVIQSTASITANMTLVNQVYFPREILVIVRLGEALVDFFFTFVTMLVINAAVGVLPTLYIFWLIPLLLIQLALTLGLMFFASYLSVHVRDIPQLVNVLIQLLFYMSPILYPLSTIPESYHGILAFNPLVTLITAYRDVIIYGRSPEIMSLYYPIVLSLLCLYSGYILFKRHERSLGDYV